ncbi:hypothetical protein CVO96_17825 [Deinococcus koreensis]|uniref:Core-binding (CB) domain-containing protein n=2 Tax=Deinococcus koreensis TaxID=2054903 RepID=A0A2K3UTD5_9DEIO|nr:hypothetical protein CVO96_17825 [Deinococcus koreensis]
MKLLAALRDADLDRLMGMLGPVWAYNDPKQLFTRLRPFFDHAPADAVNLQTPDAEFMDWVQRRAQEGRHGGTVKANTVRARISALHRLYDHLIEEGLLQTNPLRGVERPPEERKDSPPPAQGDIARLLIHARDDRELHAALQLIYHHAMQVDELLRLTWDTLDPGTGELLRKHTLTRLDDDALHALELWRATQGGNLAAGHRRIFSYGDVFKLRTKIFQLSRRANVPMMPPSELRRASLRDFPHTARSAGFADGGDGFQAAVRLAQGVAGTLDSKD